MTGMLLALCVALAPAAAAAPQIEPVFGAQFLGGQYFFSGGQGAVAGNISGMASAGVHLNERWNLFPSLRSSYRGTKDVVDLVGAGTVFQEQMDHRIGLKGSYRHKETPLRIKPFSSYSFQFLKETRDETWGSGLFDYRRLDFGVEAEWVYKEPFSVSAGLTQFFTSFPNYVSLESKASAIPGLARELAGDRVLDADGQMLRLAANAPWQGMVWEGSYAMVRQGLPNQHIVNAAGGLSSGVREDMTHILSFDARRPFRVADQAKVLTGLGLSMAFHGSDQNHYDALRTTFIKDYYDYSELRLAPSVSLTAGHKDRPLTASLEFAVAMRDYSRPIQDSAGLYQGDGLGTTTYQLSVSASRPIAPRFRAIVNIQHAAVESNQRYQQLYRYQYSATNYLFGVSYDY